jgi:hypothetical protein
MSRDSAPVARGGCDVDDADGVDSTRSRGVATATQEIDGPWYPPRSAEFKDAFPLRKE